jgi:hypothetical protein
MRSTSAAQQPTKKVAFSLMQRLYSKKTWCMGPFAGVEYNSTYLIVNSIVTAPLQRERGGVGKISPIG